MGQKENVSGKSIPHFWQTIEKPPFQNGPPHAIMMEQARRIASFLILYAAPGMGRFFYLLLSYMMIETLSAKTRGSVISFPITVV